MKSKMLPLPIALLWIIGSTIVVTGSAYSLMKGVREEGLKPEENFIYKIIQTGPHTDALRTDYLAEMMGLSSDHPTLIRLFDRSEAQKSLLKMPMIKEASISVIQPDTLYIDYTMRQPIAMLYDYENIAVDEEGFLFPFSPFFSPKILPELYFGPKATHEKEAFFQHPLEGKEWRLATRILKLLKQVASDYAFYIKRVDVSHAFESSLGRQEIVIHLASEDGSLLSQKRFFHQLRLHPQDYEQQLGNYFALYPELLGYQEVEEKIIDLRMEGLALIKDEN